MPDATPLPISVEIANEIRDCLEPRSIRDDLESVIDARLRPLVEALQELDRLASDPHGRHLNQGDVIYIVREALASAGVKIDA